MKIYRAYCDGARNHKTGISASSFIIVEDNVVRNESTTNLITKSGNEAEMQAVINALDKVRVMGGTAKDRVLVYTNLKTIPDAFNKGWIDNWVSNGWKNSDGRAVRNRDLWECMRERMLCYDSELRHAEKDEFSYCSRLKKRVHKACRVI